MSEWMRSFSFKALSTMVVLISFIILLNHCYWEQSVCLNIKIYMSNMSIFHPLVGRGSETQLQVDEKLYLIMSYFRKCLPNKF